MNKAKTNIIAQIVYQVFAVLTPLITSPYLSRVLGPAQLGRFSHTYTYVVYLMLICKLGIDTYGAREIAKTKDPEERSELFFGMFRIQLTVSVVLLALYYLVLSAGIIPDAYIMMLQGLWVVSAMVDINWFLFGMEKFVVSTIRNIAVKIFTIILIFLFVKTSADLDRYIIIMAGGQVASMLVIWPYALKRIKWSVPRLSQCRRHIRPLLYLFVPVLAMSVFHIMDKTMLGIMSNDIQSGYYYNVDRLCNIVISITLGINTVMMPRITNAMAAGSSESQIRQMLEKSYELVVSSSIALSMGLAAIAPLFVPVFFGEAFLPCVELITVFSVALICKSISGCISNQCLVPRGEEKYYIRAVIAGAVVNLFCNYFLIKSMAAMGATIGSVIAEVVVLAIVLVKSRKSSNLKKLGLDFIRYLAIGTVMFAVVRTVIPRLEGNWTSLLLVIIIGGMIFAAGTLINSWLDRKSVFADMLRRKER